LDQSNQRLILDMPSARQARFAHQHPALMDFAEKIEESLFAHFGDTGDRYKVAMTVLSLRMNE